MKTAYCFDPEHVHHADPAHPERPERLDAAMDRLREDGRLARMTEIAIAPAPMEAIERIHPAPYVTKLESVCVRGGGPLGLETYATEASFRVARRALGGLLAVTDAVMTQSCNNGFALVRPPGHHARPMHPMGFCLLGNAAAAAHHARLAHGAERVMVIDFDVHHGNGTEEMLEPDPAFAVVSSHEWSLYPGTGEIEHTGPHGQTLNLPFPARTGDAGLREAYLRTVLPFADRFRPDLVIVAAGFDAHHRDLLSNAQITAYGFAELMLAALEIADRYAGGRLVATLEGGYDEEAIADGVASCLAVMENPSAEVEMRAAPPIPGIEPDLSGLIEDVRALHRL